MNQIIKDNQNTSRPDITPRNELTSRLQKGGALLSDMRLIVRVWSDEIVNENPMLMLTKILSKATTARVRDTYIRAFRPRFVTGSPPNAWRFARVLEDFKADTQLTKPFYYWITARAETPLYGIATDIVYPQSKTTNREVRIEEAISWLNQQNLRAKKSWTPTVTRKVARGVLAALRDFGVLDGSTRKQVTAFRLHPEAFAFISFCLNGMGITGRELVKHQDWQLFLLDEMGVESLFIECHQHGWLRFDLAGEIVRIEFAEVSFKEYVNAILG